MFVENINMYNTYCSTQSSHYFTLHAKNKYILEGSWIWSSQDWVRKSLFINLGKWIITQLKWQNKLDLPFTYPDYISARTLLWNDIQLSYPLSKESFVASLIMHAYKEYPHTTPVFCPQKHKKLDITELLKMESIIQLWHTAHLMS